MRSFVFLSGAIAMLAALCSSSLLAQFQEPTKDELQMTAEPKAPGASAIYLYREDDTNLESHTRTLYERIKVLSEKGKDMATVQVPYEPAEDKVEIQGRTIHADGTIVPLTDKPSDLVDFKVKGYQHNTLVFTLPSVEVGSILDYRVTVRSKSYPDQPTWMIQQSDFVRAAHYCYKTLGFIKPGYVSRIGSDAKVAYDKNGTYSLDVKDVPALPDDDWMPPLNTFKWRISFFYSDFTTSQAYWESEGKTWAYFVRDFTKPTGTLKNAVEGMIAAKDSETEKAKKIYAAVMKLENTDFTRQKSQVERKKEKIKDIHNAQDVWKDKSGNSDEIALLFVGLCRAAGLNVESMVVVNRSKALFDEGILNSSQLEDYIAVGRLDGKEVFLDPGEKMCPFGMLHWKHTLSTGFRLTDKSASLSNTPPGSSSVQRVAYLTIDASGNVHGTVRIGLSGQDALRWRQFAAEHDEEEVKKSFNESINSFLPEGVQGEFDHFLGLDEYESSLLGTVRVNGNLGAVTGKRIFLPGLFFESKAKHPFVAQEKRVVPVDLQYARAQDDEVTYSFPAGFKLESSPEKSNIAWPTYAKLAISTTSDETQVTVSRSLISSFIILAPKEYGNLHDFYQKLAAADQQQVILIRPQPGKTD